MSVARPALALAGREVRRFFRERSRLVGALAFPILMWLLLGSGFGGTFARFFFPGTAVLILLFSAIFSMASVIEDRREGFLQAALVSPSPRAAIVLGKVLGGMLLSLPQAALFLLLAPLAGLTLTLRGYAAAVAALALLAVEMTALSFAIAWRMESVPGFHAIMNVLLIPLWTLSGAFFPAATAAPAVRALIAANPLTYGVAAVQSALGAAPPRGGWAVELGVTAAAGALLILSGISGARRARGEGA